MSDDPLIRRPGPIREYKQPIPSERYHRGARALDVAITAALLAFFVILAVLWKWAGG